MNDRHYVDAIRETEPTEPGALRGYAADCSCGWSARYSLRSMVVNQLVEHIRRATEKKEGAR